MPKKPSRKSIVKKLDTVFSQFIRRRFAVNEIARCVTCDKKAHWKELQAGFFSKDTNYCRERLIAWVSRIRRESTREESAELFSR